MADEEENKTTDDKKKNIYKLDPKLIVYDEFGYGSNEKYMKELELLKLKKKKEE